VTEKLFINLLEGVASEYFCGARIYKSKLFFIGMFIKDIFSGKYSEEEVHNEFIKFSRGDFKSKYLITGKKQKDRWVIKTGPEFVNAIVKLCLDKAPENIEMNGVIVSTMKIDAPFIKGVKQFMGIKQHQVSGMMNKKNLLEMMQKNPRVFYALSFKTDDCELKIKAKAPKSAKPSTSGDKEKPADFVSLKTGNKDIINELFFDYPDFNEISIRHTVKITDIVYPQNMAKMKPEEVRENSKRKGVLVRDAEVDGLKKSSEAGFLG
jgi:hypothetical protein